MEPVKEAFRRGPVAARAMPHRGMQLAVTGQSWIRAHGLERFAGELGGQPGIALAVERLAVGAGLQAVHFQEQHGQREGGDVRRTGIAVQRRQDVARGRRSVGVVLHDG